MVGPVSVSSPSRKRQKWQGGSIDNAGVMTRLMKTGRVVKDGGALVGVHFLCATRRLPWGLSCTHGA